MKVPRTETAAGTYPLQFISADCKHPNAIVTLLHGAWTDKDSKSVLTVVVCCKVKGECDILHDRKVKAG